MTEFKRMDKRTFGQVQSIIEPIIRRGQQLIGYIESLPNDSDNLSQNVSLLMEVIACSYYYDVFIYCMENYLFCQLVRNDALEAAQLLRKRTQRRGKGENKKPERIDLYKIFASMAELVEGLPNVIYCNIFVCKSSKDNVADEDASTAVEDPAPDDGEDDVEPDHQPDADETQDNTGNETGGEDEDGEADVEPDHQPDEDEAPDNTEIDEDENNEEEEKEAEDEGEDDAMEDGDDQSDKHSIGIIEIGT